MREGRRAVPRLRAYWESEPRALDTGTEAEEGKGLQGLRSCRLVSLRGGKEQGRKGSGHAEGRLKEQQQEAGALASWAEGAHVLRQSKPLGGNPYSPPGLDHFSPVLFLVILSHQNNHRSFSQHPTQKDHT